MESNVRYCLTKRIKSEDYYLFLQGDEHRCRKMKMGLLTFDTKKEALDYKKEHNLRGWQPETI